MRSTIVAIFALLSVILLAFTPQSGTIIYWHERNKITWQDFVVVTTINDNEDAHVNLFFDSPFQLKDSILSIYVKTCLNTNKSLVRKGEQNDTLLNHEQGHYDLQEIFARKCRKNLLEFEYKIVSLQKDLNDLIYKYSYLCTEAQKLYDTETEHSKNRKKQKEWNFKIQNDLDSLSMYSKPYVEIVVRK